MLNGCSAQTTSGPLRPSTTSPTATRLAGRYDEAIRLHRQNLTDRIRVLGADHPYTLTGRNNLANALLDAGQSGEAILLYKQNLADRLRILGPDHPDTPQSRNNLANAYGGKWAA